MSSTQKGEGKQDQTSRQSGRQGGQSGEGSGRDNTASRETGIGSSQGQDKARSPGRPSAGTPDIPRREGGEDVERPSSGDSLVGDSTGAFKERP